MIVLTMKEDRCQNSVIDSAEAAVFTANNIQWFYHEIVNKRHHNDDVNSNLSSHFYVNLKQMI